MTFRAAPRFVRCAFLFFTVFTLSVLTPAPGLAQNGPGSDALHVFFECHTRGCDQREFRTQMDWVNWVRDRNDAQVHVIVTSQETGSGGRSYQIDFIGLEDLQGADDVLTYTSLGTDVQDETVRGLARVLAIGLARYSLLIGAPVTLSVEGDTPAVPTDRLVSQEEVDDPWDFWVFQTNMNLNLSGESARSNQRVGGSFEASRTTEQWKFEFDAGGTYRRSNIELEDSTLVDERRDWRVSTDVAYALADHWSLGLEGRASAATATNQDLSVSFGPALEYSVWPYVEAPRRSFRVRYRVAMRHFDYEELSIFEKNRETRAHQSLSVSVSQREPWGNLFGSVEASHYIDNLSTLEQGRVRANGFLSFRIVRGLSLRVDGSIAFIKDQIFLPFESISDEDILLGRRRLPSSRDWDIGVGFSFQFGSIYNNVVNNRF